MDRAGKAFLWRETYCLASLSSWVFGLLSLSSASRFPCTAKVPGKYQWEDVDLKGDKCESVPEKAVWKILQIFVKNFPMKQQLLTHLPYHDFFRIFQVDVFIKLHIGNHIVHVVKNAV